MRDNTGSIEVEFNTVGGDVDTRLNIVPATFTGDPTFNCGIPSQIFGTGALSVTGNQVPSGNINVFNNFITTGSSMQVAGNNVAQVIQVFGNTGTGTKRVTGNIAGQRIQCEHNDPPFVGTPNVAPEQQGQCAPPEV